MQIHPQTIYMKHNKEAQYVCFVIVIWILWIFATSLAFFKKLTVFRTNPKQQLVIKDILTLSYINVTFLYIAWRVDLSKHFCVLCHLSLRV